MDSSLEDSSGPESPAGEGLLCGPRILDAVSNTEAVKFFSPAVLQQFCLNGFAS